MSESKTQKYARYFQYRTPGQRLHNRQVLARDEPKPTSDVVERPWLSNKVVTQLPSVRHEFEQNRDPNRAMPTSPQDKIERQRRDDQAGRNSRMVTQDQPRANLTPPPTIRTPADNQRFEGKWLAEQRDAAMAQNALSEPYYPQDQQVTPKYHGPER